MNASSRWLRVVWLLGFILLLGTTVGAGLVLNQSAAKNPSSQGADRDNSGIVGLGYGDIEGGIAYLHPLQSGRVEAVHVNEGDHVTAGQLLLSLDSNLQQYNLKAAEANLKQAEIAWDHAKVKLVEKWKLRMVQFAEQVNIARYKAQFAENDLKIAQNMHKNSKQREINDEELDKATKNVDIAKAAERAAQTEYELVEKESPQVKIDQAAEDFKGKQALRDQARQALLECEVFAPADGTILRVFARKGDVLNGPPRQAAVHFCPAGPRMIRVEILQEYASKIEPGQLAFIEDDTRAGVLWKGKVQRVGDWFGPRRQVIQEPFQYNDVRMLECIVYVDEGGPTLRLGQRVRVTIKQGGL